MIILNLKKVATAALGALVLTMVLSWTFVFDTSVVHLPRDAGHGAQSFASALVR